MSYHNYDLDRWSCIPPIWSQSVFWDFVGKHFTNITQVKTIFKALHLSLLISPVVLWIILTWLGKKYFSETEEDLNALFSRRIVQLYGRYGMDHAVWDFVSQFQLLFKLIELIKLCYEAMRWKRLPWRWRSCCSVACKNPRRPYHWWSPNRWTCRNHNSWW